MRALDGRAIRVAVDIDRLKSGAHVRLPGQPGVVQLVNVTPGPFYELIFKRPDDGGLGQLVLSEDELTGVEVIEQQEELRFDGDAKIFRLGMEAHRISLAFTYEMAAVAVSNIRPLALQLDAVYGSFLKMPRLRYLLADDPGAGKTIMAGLYMKELELRGVGGRILVVAPANLRPQWIRELRERFRLDFVSLEANHFDGFQNPFDLYDRAVISRDLLRTDRVRKRVEEAERRWDVTVFDEAHGLTLEVDANGGISKKTKRYQAAEEVVRRSDRLILMTATPHSGRPESLWGLLRLLDMDVFGNRCPQQVNPPEHLFRKVTKEQMTDLAGQPLFKDRHAHTLGFEITGKELELYNRVTEFIAVRLAEIRGETSRTTAGFALTTMQRRMASSARAIRRTLERRIDRLERALREPEKHLRDRADFQKRLAEIYDDLDELSEEERWTVEDAAIDLWLPETIEELRAEQQAVLPLRDLAEEVEADHRNERKLTELLDVLRNRRLWEDRSQKLLIFTEHRDTLEYLVERLRPDFEVAFIHGGMKLEDRIAAERHFHDRAQIMVATEAAGEGINLQFCHLMVNYDIPWNPMRLEQRMGRVHRIGQTEEVHVFNLVAQNTREGYVLYTLLKKLESISEELGDRVFDVVGATFAQYGLQQLLEEVIAGEISREEGAARLGGTEADPAIVQRVNELLQNALARAHLDWQDELRRHARAEADWLPPGHFERFFVDAIQHFGGRVTRRLDRASYRVERVPDVLVARSRLQEGAVQRVQPSYERLTFDREVVEQSRSEEGGRLPPAELCGPGHPLFDALVQYVIEQAQPHLDCGAIFFNPDADEPAVLRFLVGDVVDSGGGLVQRKLAMARERIDGVRTPGEEATLFDLTPATAATPPDDVPSVAPAAPGLETWARQQLFERVYQQARQERERVAAIQEEFVRRSCNQLISESDIAAIKADEEGERGVPGAEGRRRIAELEKRGHELRRERALAEIEQGREVRRGQIRVLGSALLLPLAEADGVAVPEGRPTAADREVERIAVEIARRHEEERGATVISEEEAKVGYDLLSLRGTERRCIEVKGRAGVGRVELTWSEVAKSQELADDYWLYVVLDCRSPAPRLYRVRNPSKALAGALRPSLDVRFVVDPEQVVAVAEEASA